MYLTAGSNVFALEPETGRQIWRFEAPGVGQPARRCLLARRREDAGPRLFTGAGDRLLGARRQDRPPGARVRHARPGRAEPGHQGRRRRPHQPACRRRSSTRTLLITGGNNGEQAPSLGLYGDIRGWDARTGALKWTFHTVPRAGEPGVETWEGDSWKNRSGTNMWSFFTVDTERGLRLRAARRRRPSDYYGGDRKGKNLYGNSIVALDATTGALKWHHQLVHHDLWDFDMPAAPTLIDVRRERPDHPGRRGDDEDDAALHLRSRHRRADLRHGGAAGPARAPCPASRRGRRSPSR